MKIDAGTLLKTIPAQSRGKIPGSKALEIVHSIYCGPMTARGLCTGRCGSCAEGLLGAFSLEGAKNEQALLTWRLKDLLARVQESAGERKAAPTTDRFGLPVSEDANPFGALREQYEKQAKSG